MKKLLISYANGAFRASQERLVASAMRNGFSREETWSVTPRDLKGTEFHRRNKRVLKESRGAGYWLWKPHIILEALTRSNPADFVIYSDAGIEILQPLDVLFPFVENAGGILLFDNLYQGLSTWTKRDCFVLMGCDSYRFHNGRILSAGFQIYQPTDRAVAFVEEWRTWCEDPRILTDKQNVSGRPNLPDFVAHRHDQSVLSIMSIREGLPTYRDPSQWGNHLKAPAFRRPNDILPELPYSQMPDNESAYGTLLNHHRSHRRSLLRRLASIATPEPIKRYIKRHMRNWEPPPVPGTASVLSDPITSERSTSSSTRPQTEEPSS